MKNRTFIALSFAAFAWLSSPAIALAQTDDHSAAAAQNQSVTPAPASHDHDASAPAGKAAMGCCGQMMKNGRADQGQAAAKGDAPKVAETHDHAATSGQNDVPGANQSSSSHGTGCCAGMSHETGNSAADNSVSEHTCCCSAGKM